MDVVSPKISRRVALLFLTFITLLAFSGVVRCDFLSSFDDERFILKNPHLQAGLTPEAIRWAFSAGLSAPSRHTDYWQPITWLSRMLDVTLFGFEPSMHHLVNLFFHLLNVLLLFHILNRMTGSCGRSALVAALFAVHPMHVESVAFVTERKDVLSGLFWMLTIWAYWNYSIHLSNGINKAISWKWYLLAFLFFTLGLMAKPMVGTLPLILLLLDHWPLRRLQMRSAECGVRRLFVEKLPFLALVLLDFFITMKSQSKVLPHHSLSQTLEFALASYPLYFIKLLFPIHLTFYYPRVEMGLRPEAIGLDFTLLLVSIWTLIRARRFPALFVGWGWMIIGLLPVVSLGDLIMSDHFTYLPAIGFFIFLIWGISMRCKTQKKKGGISKWFAGGIIMVLVCMSWNQVRFWRNSETLALHGLQVDPNNYIAHYALGTFLAGNGKLDQAMEEYKRTLEIIPVFPPAHNDLGAVLAMKGKSREAEEHFKQALKVDPQFVEAHYNLGGLLQSDGQWEEAAQSYHRAIEIDPLYSDAQFNLGNLHKTRNKIPEAMDCYRAAIKGQPNFEKAHNNLGICLAQKGKFDEAMAEYRTALQLKPGNSGIYYNMGIALLRQGKMDEAIRYLKMALIFRPNDSTIQKALEKIRKPASP